MDALTRKHFTENESYLRGLNRLIFENPSKNQTQLQEKSEKLLKSLFEQKIIEIEGESSSLFYQKIMKTLRKISHICPGRKLLKLIKMHVKSMKMIKSQDGQGTRFDHKKDAIICNPYMHTYQAVSAEKIVMKIKFSVIVAHEMIHLVNYCRDKEEYLALSDSTEGLIDIHFDDIEEQRTIAGFKNVHQLLSGELSLCENAFLQAWGRPLVISHRGMDFPGDLTLLPSEYMLSVSLYGLATGSVKKILENEPALASKRLFLLDSSPYPLTIAVLLNDDEMIDILLSHGAKVGTPIDKVTGGLIISAWSYYEDEEMLMKFIEILKKEEPTDSYINELILEVCRRGYSKEILPILMGAFPDNTLVKLFLHRFSESTLTGWSRSLYKREQNHQKEALEKFHEENKVKVGNEKIEVDLSALNLPKHLEKPMRDIVKEINSEIENNWKYDRKDRKILLSGMAPSECVENKDENTERQNRIFLYNRTVPHHDQPSEHLDLFSGNVMSFCFQILIEKKIIFSYENGGYGFVYVQV